MVKKFDKFITENTDEESNEVFYVLYNLGKEITDVDKRVGVEEVHRDEFDDEEDFIYGVNDTVDEIEQKTGAKAIALTQEELEKIIYKLHPNH